MTTPVLRGGVVVPEATEAIARCVSPEVGSPNAAPHFQRVRIRRDEKFVVERDRSRNLRATSTRC